MARRRRGEWNLMKTDWFSRKIASNWATFQFFQTFIFEFSVQRRLRLETPDRALLWAVMRFGQIMFLTFLQMSSISFLLPWTKIWCKRLVFSWTSETPHFNSFFMWWANDGRRSCSPPTATLSASDQRQWRRPEKSDILRKMVGFFEGSAECVEFQAARTARPSYSWCSCRRPTRLRPGEDWFRFVNFFQSISFIDSQAMITTGQFRQPRYDEDFW